MRRGVPHRIARARARALGPGVCAALALAACSPLAPAGVSSEANEIYGGTSDTTDDAVMALIHQMGNSTSACTATTIAKVGASGILLTAGHCVIITDGMGHIVTPLQVAPPTDLYVVPGPDWQSSLNQSLYYGVVDVKTHPSYDGDVNSPFDVALIRYVGTTASSPVVPAATPADDTLAVGSTITLVGFGKTDKNAMNSARNKVDRTIAELSAQQFLYDQRDMKGACQGDSGGPAFFQSAAGRRVVGVTSFGDPSCTTLGASVRVSPVSSFIQSFINSAPATLGCSECTLASVGPGNACVQQSAACGNLTTACGKYLNCAAACTTQSCVQNCATRQAAGAQAYTDMVKCQCGNSCATACATNATCMAVGGGTTDPTTPVMPTMPTMPTKPTTPNGPLCGGLTDARPECASCIMSSCCIEASDCAADAACADCLTSPSAACTKNAAYVALTSCEATCTACSAPAPQLQPDAGTPPDSGTNPNAGPGQTGGKAGCSCSAGGSGSSAAALGPLAALLLLAARRRRARASHDSSHLGVGDSCVWAAPRLAKRGEVGPEGPG
jgi:MYXO-CTERM domain-containing protein